MSNVQYLTDANFSLNGQKMVCNTQSPVSFVLFRITTCKNSDIALQSFITMAKYEKRVKFAVVDVSKFRTVIEMSKSTNLPIKSSPTIVLYVNGVANVNYKKERSVEKLQFFLNQVLPTIQQKSTFIDTPQRATSSSGSSSSSRGEGNGIYMPTMDRDISGSAIHMEEENIKTPNKVTPYNEPWKKK